MPPRLQMLSSIGRHPNVVRFVGVLFAESTRPPNADGKENVFGAVKENADAEENFLFNGSHETAHQSAHQASHGAYKHHDAAHEDSHEAARDDSHEAAHEDSHEAAHEDAHEAANEARAAALRPALVLEYLSGCEPLAVEWTAFGQLFLLLLYYPRPRVE